MDVLLIGATGYIGSAVAGVLQAVGHRIHGLTRSDQAARTLLGPYADVLSLDQHISGSCGSLGWRPAGPSVIEELEHGSYSRPMR